MIATEPITLVVPSRISDADRQRADALFPLLGLGSETRDEWRALYAALAAASALGGVLSVRFGNRSGSVYATSQTRKVYNAAIEAGIIKARPHGVRCRRLFQLAKKYQKKR